MLLFHIRLDFSAENYVVDTGPFQIVAGQQPKNGLIGCVRIVEPELSNLLYSVIAGNVN